MRKVDAEVRRIIDEQYTIARKLIEDNQDKMHAMAKRAARVGDHRRRPDRRHHGRQAAAAAEGLVALGVQAPSGADPPVSTDGAPAPVA